MAKTYEELLEQAAIIRDETAAGKNTATRVGGTITEAVEYVKELKDTYAGIHAEAAAAKQAAAAANTKNAEQDGKISSLEAKDATHDTKIAKLEERALQYIYPKIYQLNEGAGARVFHGFYKGSASVSDERKTASEEGYSYKVVFKSGSFYLQEISPEGVTVLYSSWAEISLPNNKSIASSESYAQRDCLYYIYVEGEGSTYYYIDSNGVASEQSATYLLRRLVDKNASSIAAASGTANDAKATAEAAKATADAASTAAQEANTTATDAQAEASEAKATAAAAKLTAEEAKTNAGSARSVAQSAQLTANAAKATADAASTAAQEAKTTATDAKEEASEAKTEAAAAKLTASEAKTNAGSARSIAQSSVLTANEAKSTADAASTAAQEAKTTANSAQTKNNDQDARLEKIENSVSPLSTAGRYWNEANGTPTAAGHYGSLDALRSLPEMLGLGRYLVKDDRTRRKLDPKDSTKYADDGTDAKLDGTEGQCMWCWNGFYANVWKEGDNLFKVVSFHRPVGNDISIWIPAGGISWLGAGVMDRGEAPYTDKTKWKLCSVINNSEQFRGGVGVALDASKYSKAPADTTPQITMLCMPATYISTTDFGTYARKRGEGWEANWFVARFVVEFLFEVIMGTENSQEAFNANKDANGLYQGGFGTGVTDMTDWGNYNGYYPLIPTSVGLEVGDGVCTVEYKLPQTNGVDGDTYKTFQVPVFFGLVGAGFGHFYQLVSGLIMDVGEEQSLVYVSPSMYAAYDPNTVADKILVAECPRVTGWIMRKSYKGLCCMPTKIGGSATIRFADFFYTNTGHAKGLCVRAAGGRSPIGNQSGVSFTYSDITATDASAFCSSPLCYFDEDPIIPDSQSIENNS